MPAFKPKKAKGTGPPGGRRIHSAFLADLAEPPPVVPVPAFYNYTELAHALWQPPASIQAAATHTLRLSVRRVASAVGPSFRGKSSCKSRYPSAGDMHASMGHIQMSSPPSNYSKQVQTNRRNETRVLRLYGNSV